MATTWDKHNVDSFSDTVQQLLGEPQVAYLPMACTQDNQSGVITAHDAIGGSDADDATADTYASIDNPETDRAPSSVSDLLDTMTPNQDPNKVRSLSSTGRIKWGTVISSEAKALSLSDPTNPTTLQAVRKINAQRNTVVRTALGAATVSRGRNESGASAVSFPAGQQLSIDASASLTTFSLDHIALIKSMLEENYGGDQFFMAIHPYLKYSLLKNSGSIINSHDFVDSVGQLSKTKLPDIYGCTVIVDPGLEKPSNGDAMFYAWAKSAVVYNTAQTMVTDSGIDPAFQFGLRLYLHEMVSSVRTDDLGVIQVTYACSSSSSS